MAWDRRRYDWLPKFPDGCQVFYAEDSGMIVVNRVGKDVTTWAVRPPFSIVSECPWCDTMGMHFMFEPGIENRDPTQPVIVRECACGRQWMERM
jgi:hypothetical protein